jgi:lysine-N-methylase
MDISLPLPTTQNWTCQSCSACCRQRAVNLSEDERQRILSQGWGPKDGTPEGDALFELCAGPSGNRQYRLAHQPKGAGVSLDERNLCRTHAKFGEAAKPLPCRVFPFAFHPAGRTIAVSLQFSCPSVAANHGKPLDQQAAAIKRLARTVAPDNYRQLPPPDVTSRMRVDWPGFLRFTAALDKTLAPGDVPIALKVQRALFWLDLVESRLDQISRDEVAGFLDFIHQAACNSLPAEKSSPPTVAPPSASARMLFRQLTARYARQDTVADVASGWMVRWRLLCAAVRFARGTGSAPPLQPVFRKAPFKSLEQPFGMPAECESIWTRYFRVKVQGLHFCGPALYGLSLRDGFHDLALILPVTIWIARWLAVSRDRTHLTTEDVSQALSISDYHFGCSPLLGASNSRRQVRMLSQTREIPTLIRWYVR